MEIFITQCDFAYAMQKPADIFPVIIFPPHTSTFQIIKMGHSLTIVRIIDIIIIRIIGLGHRTQKS